MKPSSLSRKTSVQRRLVCAALFTPVAQATPLRSPRASADPSLDYLAALSRELGLQLTPQVHRKLRAALPAVRQREILLAVHQRLRTVVGDAWHTARETVPACVEDDLTADRAEVIGGLSFSHTELALMLATGGGAA